MSGWVRAIERGWVVRDQVPGPDVDEFAEPGRVVATLKRYHERTLLAVQHPHRTPEAIAAGLSLDESIPAARGALKVLLHKAYREVSNVVAPYRVDGPDGSAYGVLCLVDPAAVDEIGNHRVRSSEEVYPEIAAERAKVLTGLGAATSAAMLIPVSGADELTGAVRSAIESAGEPVVSTVDGSGRRHWLWLLENGPAQAKLLDVASAQPVLVADGNHRVAAARAAGLDGMLALITAGPGLRINAFHRVLTGTGLGAEELAAAWRGVGVEVAVKAALTAPDAVKAPFTAPERPGTMVVHSGPDTLLVDLPPSTVDHTVVENLLLHKALGLDPAGPQVIPLPDGRPVPPDADAVLLLAPVPLDVVRAEHAAGRRMPRKSTYFTPKPRSGLLIAAL